MGVRVCVLARTRAPRAVEAPAAARESDEIADSRRAGASGWALGRRGMTSTLGLTLSLGSHAHAGRARVRMIRRIRVHRTVGGNRQDVRHGHGPRSTVTTAYGACTACSAMAVMHYAHDYASMLDIYARELGGSRSTSRHEVDAARA